MSDNGYYAYVSNASVQFLSANYPTQYANATSAAAAGWLLYIDQPPSYNSDTQALQSLAPTITAANATANYSVVNLTSAQMASNLANAQATALATLTSYRANSAATMSYLGYRAESGDRAMCRATVDLMAIQSAATVLLSNTTTTTTVQWEIAPGVFLAWSQNDLQKFLAACENHVEAGFSNEQVLSAQVMACKTPSQVAAVNLNTGWPT